MKYLNLTALLLGVLLTISPRATAAPAERVPVTGLSDLLGGQVGGDLVPDAHGNLHLETAAFRGSFALHGDGVDIVGSQQVVLYGVLDQTLSGPVAGSFTITAELDGQPTTIWKGTIHGVVDALIFTGQASAHGMGPYAGQRLTLYFQERAATPETPNPEVFDLAGFLSRDG